MAVTSDLVRGLLDYAPETGVFTWREARGGSAQAGTVAGSIVGGYRRIKLEKKLHAAHRLAWLYVYGVWPDRDVDHINNDRDDNRLANLRLATRAQNIANTKVRRDSKSGLRGVSKREGGYVAQVTIDGDKKYLGWFKTAEAAHAAYVTAAKAHYGEFHRV